MKKILKGVMPPVVTPFIDEDLDLTAFRANIERWNKSGLSGYLVAGSNGEAVYLNEAEKDALWSAAVEAADPEMVIMAGTGCESTRETIKLTRRAAELGADCALVITPAYFKGQMTSKSLAGHFLKTAEASTIPLLLYNFPQSTGVNLNAETVALLARHDNIVGIKDSSGNIVQLNDIMRLVPEDFAVFTGNAEVFFPALCLGVKGAILAAANVVPELLVELYRSFGSGKQDQALALQKKISRLAAMVTRIHGVGGLKAAMEISGYQPGGVRSPLVWPGAEVVEELRAELAKQFPQVIE